MVGAAVAQRRTLGIGVDRPRRTLTSALKCWGAAELREMMEAGRG